MKKIATELQIPAFFVCDFNAHGMGIFAQVKSGGMVYEVPDNEIILSYYLNSGIIFFLVYKESQLLGAPGLPGYPAPRHEL